MSDDKEKIESGELSELKIKDQEESNLAKILGIVVGLILVSIVHNFYSMYEMWTDDSVSFVQCPRQFNLDRPVILKKMENASILQQDNWVRSFAINFAMKLYPRAVEDAEPFFEYIANHTEGYLQKKYLARVDKIDVIQKDIGIGSYRKFYIDNSNEIKIRSVKNANGSSWKIIINGYLHTKKLAEMEKTQPRLELLIRTVPPTITNPEGLLVENFNLIYIKDPISGEEVNL